MSVYDLTIDFNASIKWSEDVKELNTQVETILKDTSNLLESVVEDDDLMKELKALGTTLGTAFKNLIDAFKHAINAFVQFIEKHGQETLKLVEDVASVIKAVKNVLV